MYVKCPCCAELIMTVCWLLNTCYIQCNILHHFIIINFHCMCFISLFTRLAYCYHKMIGGTSRPNLIQSKRTCSHHLSYQINQVAKTIVLFFFSNDGILTRMSSREIGTSNVGYPVRHYPQVFPL